MPRPPSVAAKRDAGPLEGVSVLRQIVAVAVQVPNGIGQAGVRRAAVKDSNVVALLKENANQVWADEAGGADGENGHGAL